MAKYYGSDADASSIAWQFRGIKAGAKVQKNAVAKGDDPKDFNVDLNYKGQPRAREVHRGKCALKELLSSQHFLLFCIFISRSKTQ